MKAGASPTRTPRRIAMLSVHTSPLDQPGSGDAGGMNVYIAEVSRRLAAGGTAVEIFTRATRPDSSPQVELAPGVLVHNIVAGPVDGSPQDDLPTWLCAMTAGVLRRHRAGGSGRFDLIHSHYWLSGQVGWLAKGHWGAPLVHTMHTMGRVKNRDLAPDDRPEPALRITGEQEVVDAADRLVANTHVERADLIDLYGADPALVDVVLPGVDLQAFRPGDPHADRATLGLYRDELVVLFVGRIQPLKAPDLLLRAAAELRRRDPHVVRRLRLVVCGAPSGTGLEHPTALADLADRLGLDVTFVPPASRTELRRWYSAADVVAVPSHSESFGLVALEAQACGTPVLAARVGGLPITVADGTSGMLVDGHEPSTWATALQRILADDRLRARLADGCRAHAEAFGWDATVRGLRASYGLAMSDPRDALSRVS